MRGAEDWIGVLVSSGVSGRGGTNTGTRVRRRRTQMYRHERSTAHERDLSACLASFDLMPSQAPECKSPGRRR